MINLRIDGPVEMKPMDEVDVQLAIRIKQIVRQYGSIGAWHQHMQAEKKRQDAELLAEQLRRIRGDG